MKYSVRITPMMSENAACAQISAELITHVAVLPAAAPIRSLIMFTFR